jgi:hypothetical protein
MQQQRVSTFDFYAVLIDGRAHVAFARPFFDCVGVQILDGCCASAAAPLFVRETNVERRMYPDRASEPQAIVALGCIAGNRALVGHVGPDPQRRTIGAPFALDALDLRLEDADGAPATPPRAVLLIRLLSRA